MYMIYEHNFPDRIKHAFCVFKTSHKFLDIGVWNFMILVDVAQQKAYWV